MHAVRHRRPAAADAMHALRLRGLPPYAEAIARGAADINQCPPGGTETIVALAALPARAATPLNPDNGIEAAPTVAYIDEERCIGCTKCLPPCPVDAIVGARQRMHTVVAELCTGCELCVAPCPVDCIVMIPLLAPRAPRWRCRTPTEAAQRFAAHNARVARAPRDKRRGARRQEARRACQKPPP